MQYRNSELDFEGGEREFDADYVPEPQSSNVDREARSFSNIRFTEMLFVSQRPILRFSTLC